MALVDKPVLDSTSGLLKRRFDIPASVLKQISTARNVNLLPVQIEGVFKFFLVRKGGPY